MCDLTFYKRPTLFQTEPDDILSVVDRPSVNHILSGPEERLSGPPAMICDSPPSWCLSTHKSTLNSPYHRCVRFNLFLVMVTHEGSTRKARFWEVHVFIPRLTSFLWSPQNLLFPIFLGVRVHIDWRTTLIQFRVCPALYWGGEQNLSKPQILRPFLYSRKKMLTRSNQSLKAKKHPRPVSLNGNYMNVRETFDSTCLNRYV